jgi:hypothetical protein
MIEKMGEHRQSKSAAMGKANGPGIGMGKTHVPVPAVVAYGKVLKHCRTQHVQTGRFTTSGNTLPQYAPFKSVRKLGLLNSAFGETVVIGLLITTTVPHLSACC